MNRSDWLLAFLGVTAAGRPGDVFTPGPSLDPIRLQKGVFLFQEQDGTETANPLLHPPYVFEPYAYGPFSQAIYADLEDLQRAGLVKRIPVEGQTYARWQLTPAGYARLTELLAADEISPDIIARLRRAKSLVTTRGFTGLLRYVYARYPQYAIESVAKL